jgi:hypothetical protein
MNPVTHTYHARRATHSRLGAGAWDDFEPAPRPRRRHAPVASTAVRTKAHPEHAHLSWTETPDLYLREEMS